MQSYEFKSIAFYKGHLEYIKSKPESKRGFLGFSIRKIRSLKYSTLHIKGHFNNFYQTPTAPPPPLSKAAFLAS